MTLDREKYRALLGPLTCQSLRYVDLPRPRRAPGRAARRGVGLRRPRRPRGAGGRSRPARTGRSTPGRPPGDGAPLGRRLLRGRAVVDAGGLRGATGRRRGPAGAGCATAPTRWWPPRPAPTTYARWSSSTTRRRRGDSGRGGSATRRRCTRSTRWRPRSAGTPPGGHLDRPGARARRHRRAARRFPHPTTPGCAARTRVARRRPDDAEESWRLEVSMRPAVTTRRTEPLARRRGRESCCGAAGRPLPGAVEPSDQVEASPDLELWRASPRSPGPEPTTEDHRPGR